MDRLARLTDPGDFRSLPNTPHLRSRRGIVLGVAGGILLVCLTLFFLATWGGSSTSAASQERVAPMTLAAEKYWRSLTLTQAQKDFAGWNRDDLARLFATVQRQTTDPEIHQRVEALAQFLRLPGAEPPASNPLMSTPVLLLGVLLALAPVVLAGGLVMRPRFRKPREASVTVLAGIAAAEETLQPVVEEVEIEEEVAPAPTEKPEEKKPEVIVPEEKEEPDPGLGDLADLFEEEDTSMAALEVLCKGMPNVDIEELSKTAAQIVERLRYGRPMRAGGAA